MKKLKIGLAFSFALTLCSLAFASGSDMEKYVNAVKSSKATRQVLMETEFKKLIKVEKTKSFLALGQYQFELTFESESTQFAVLKLRTELVPVGDLASSGFGRVVRVNIVRPGDSDPQGNYIMPAWQVPLDEGFKNLEDLFSSIQVIE